MKGIRSRTICQELIKGRSAQLCFPGPPPSHPLPADERPLPFVCPPCQNLAICTGNVITESCCKRLLPLQPWVVCLLLFYPMFFFSSSSHFLKWLGKQAVNEWGGKASSSTESRSVASQPLVVTQEWNKKELINDALVCKTTRGSAEKEILRSLMDLFKMLTKAFFKTDVCGHYVENIPFYCVQILSELHQQYISSGLELTPTKWCEWRGA